MPESPLDAQPTPPEAAAGDTRVRYPTNSVLGVVDAPAQLERAVAALTSGGFLADEIQVATGAAAADAVHASTGRSGLASLAVRIAERLGIQDDEMEFKAHYEQALRDGRFVVMVSAATEARKERATELLREHGAHAVSFHGRFTIEGLVPPRGD
jgi:hypothetical protein